MLKAVERMLPCAEAEPTDMANVMTRIDCARAVLFEIISNLEKNLPTEVTQVLKPIFTERTTPSIIPGAKTEATPEPKPEIEVTGEQEWMITLDESGGLKIVDFPLDGLVELDGKKMPYSEARGQKFKKAKIL